MPLNSVELLSLAYAAGVDLLDAEGVEERWALEDLARGAARLATVRMKNEPKTGQKDSKQAKTTEK